MSDDDRWQCLLCRYIDHGSPEGIDAWTQVHLMDLIELAEAELRKRHAPVYDAPSDQPKPHVAQSVERRPEIGVQLASKSQTGPKDVGATPSVRFPDQP